MCLGIPAKIIAITDLANSLALAETAGVQRQVSVAMLTLKGKTIESLVGEWVLLHVGFAMALINQEEADRALDLLAQMDPDSQ
ncbi:HypC/HybG/HupF family hydrogenase formation chaperone [Endozoicomonas sp. SM1973]|uniref:HypC/HybG/HupF family hydrogenase formation chaperone n=1 Tax=Spartinivicinus marinus TaxID=2994442 RepID=A0A853ICN7_9GAMM|nr:HypC/HybG/HupF family hydrogenase formation chaperone [Spartinivicinus marinus]MCX4029664.1 HypC/HybG/HupF family hydrogenase formation chaperone [Spartinivicinus marinus]NYZ66955.1 HypC/HybG/HupF family hydrogenase formation chaperone [Spartinivicinus marinus]